MGIMAIINIHSFIAGIDFRRQNVECKVVMFWRLKSNVSTLKCAFILTQPVTFLPS